MSESSEITPLEVTSDDWRWAARELAADTELVIVSAIARQPRRQMRATLNVEDDFRDLSEAYRRIEVRPLGDRGLSFRQRLLRLLEHRLENRDMVGIAWAIDFVGIGPVKPYRKVEAGEGQEGRPLKVKRNRIERIADGTPGWDEFLAGLTEKQLKELEDYRSWVEFTDPEQGLLITSSEVGEARAILLLRKSRRMVEKGVIQLTDAPPHEHYHEPETGLSLADPQLPEARAIERLLEVRALVAIEEAREEAEIAATPTYNTFEAQGWPREKIDEDMIDEFGETPPEARAPDWRDIPEYPTLPGQEPAPIMSRDDDVGRKERRPAPKHTRPALALPRGRRHTKPATPQEPDS